MEWLSAVLGLVGAVVGALITGVVEFVIMRKTFENDYLKFRLELKEKFETVANSDNEDFYNGWLNELGVYKGLLNELHYLNNIANPKRNYKENGLYPYIENKIAYIVGDCELPPAMANLLGALRCNIDIYNTLIQQKANIEIIEKAIMQIYNLVSPIREEQFTNYMAIKNSIREYNRNRAENIAKDYQEVSN